MLYTDAWQIILTFCDNRSAARTLSVCHTTHSASDLVRWAPVDCTGRFYLFPTRGRIVSLEIETIDHEFLTNKLAYIEDLTMLSIKKEMPVLFQIRSLKVKEPITKVNHIMHLTTLTALDISVPDVVIPSDMFPLLANLKIKVYKIIRGTFRYWSFHTLNISVWEQLTTLFIDYLPDNLTNEMMPRLTRLTVTPYYTKKIPFVNLTHLAILDIPDMAALAHLNITHLKTDILKPIPKGIWPNLTRIDCRILTDPQYVSKCESHISITAHDFNVFMDMDVFLSF